jgi:hypothetical protein
MRFHRFATVVGLFLALAALAWSQDVGTKPDKKERPVRLDLYGDPLPKGAVSRLGTMRWRAFAYRLDFSPDGR